jgi:ABC-type amino acid transport substrate-binding protein
VAIRQYLYQDLGMDKAGSGMPAAMPGNFAEFASQDQQVKFFFAGRSDAIVIDRSIFQWYATRLGLLADSENSLEIRDIFPARHGVQAVFKDQKMCGLFDAGLAAIVADGTYRAIWQSYGIDDVAGPLL